MTHISDEQLLKHISDAVTGSTPDITDDLWNEPVVSDNGSEWYLDTSNTCYKKKKKTYLISAVAACCMLCLISLFMFQTVPSASIYLDVNPSILLKVNYKDQVTDTIPKNDDAKQILKDLDLHGADLNVALYAILGSMVHNGYLSTNTDTVLVSVHSANTNRADELENTVSTIITDDLNQLIQSSEVLTQSIDTDEIKIADDDVNETPGKDAFIDDLLEQYPQLEKYPLKSMNIDQIVSLLNQNHLDYSHYTNRDEDHNSDTKEVDDDDDDDDNDNDDDDDDDNDDDNDDDD